MAENLEREEAKHGEAEAGEPQLTAARGLDGRAGYLAFAAHEVRNPLSTALWSAELLSRMAPEERGGARGEKLSAMCLRALARIRNLIEDHFLIERLDAGGLPMRTEAVPLAEVVQAVLARRSRELGPVEVELGEELTVHCDRALLERIVDAVLVAAGHGGAASQLVARRSDAGVTVQVRGAPPNRAALADPSRGSPSEGKGSSLALPAARRAALALGAALDVAGDAWVLTLAAEPRGSVTRPP